MKYLLCTVFFSFCSLSIVAQVETTTPRTLDLSGLTIKEQAKEKDNKPESNLDSELTLPIKNNYLSQKSFSGFNYNSKIDDENFGTLQPIQMNFSTATQKHKYITNQQPRYLQKQEGDFNFYKRNQKLADLRTNSKFLILRFRDYANIDGDVIKLIVNDEVLIQKANLVGSYSQVKIQMPTAGFYKIDFLALNMGAFAPNTAQLKIVDDKFETIVNDKWALHTGFKATVVVIKE